MARRNVDLVIRARDEASQALRRLSGGIKQFTTTQQELQQESAETGAAVRRLNRDLRQSGAAGAAGQDRFTQQAAARRREIELLSTELREARQANTGYAQSLSNLGNRIAALRAEEQRRLQAVERQRAVLAESTAEQNRLQRQVRGAAQATSRAADAVQRASERYGQSRQRLEELNREFQRLGASTRQGLRATTQQQRRLETLRRRIQQVAASTRTYRENLAATRAATEEQAAGIQRVRQAYASATSRIAEQSAVLDRLNTSLRASRDNLAGSIADQRRLGRTAEQTARQIERLTAAQAQARLGRVQQAAAGVAGAPGDTGARATGLRALRDGVQDLQRYRQATEEARARTTALGAELARLGDRAGPELRARFAAARTELQQLRQRMGDLASANNRLRATLRGTGQAFSEIGVHAERAGQQMQRVARTSEQSANAIRRSNDSSRRALSLFQRLRSEVIALAAAYVGLFGAIRGIDSVVDALRTLEGAQSRLLGVFDGDQIRAGEELEFVRQQARTLGIEFGVLADAYSKFAIATQGTNLEGNKTRIIFQQVAEAARVNQLATTDMVAVFRALEQIANKGVFQMEELRQQLGDRLPGATNILAEALDVPTEVLSELLELGQVGAEHLEDFGNALEERYGDQLPNALLLTEARVGRLRNSLFELSLAIGQGAFREAFHELLTALTVTVESSDFREFADVVSEALAGLARAATFLARNWDALVIVLTTFVALRLGIALTQVFGRVSTRLSDMAARATAAATSFRALTVAFRSFLASTGVGLVFAAAGAALGLMSTRASEASTVLDQHREVVNRVRDAYRELEGAIGDAASVLDTVTQTELQANLDRVAAAYEDALDDIRDALPSAGLAGLGRGGQAVEVFRSDLRGLFDELSRGDITIAQFIRAVDIVAEVWRDASPAVEAFAQEVIATARLAEPFEQSWREALALVADADAAAEALENAGDTAEETAERNNVSLRQAQAENSRVNSLIKERQSLLERYQAQIGRGAEIETIRRTEAEINRVNQALQASTLTALELFRSLDLGNPELTRAVRAQVDALIASLENTEATLGDATLRPVANFFRQRFQQFSQLQDVIVSEIQQQVERGLTLDNIDFGPVIDAQQASVRAAEAALRRYRGLDNQTAEIQTIIARLEAFIRASGEDVARIQVMVAEGRVRELEGLRDTLQQALADQVRAGADAETVFSTRLDLRGVEDDLRRALEVSLQWLETLDATEPAVRALQEGFRVLLEDLDDGTALTEIDALNDRIAALGQIRQELLQALSTVIIAGGSDAQIAALQAQIAALETQMLTAAGTIRILRQHLEELGLEAEQLDAVLNNLEQTLQSGTENAALDAANQRVQDLLRVREALLNAPLTGVGDVLSVGGEFGQVNEELAEALDNAIAMADALSGTSNAARALAQELRAVRAETQGTGAILTITFEQVSQIISGSATRAVDTFAQSIVNGASVTDSLKTAFLQFASDFLRQIAQMILQQTILNALQAAFGFGGFGFGLFHEGGVVGETRVRTRQVPAYVFRNAVRLHDGTGFSGLRRNEYPAILERGESVLTERQTDAVGSMLAGGGSGGGTADVTVINAVDSASFLEEALRRSEGREAVLNVIQAERAAVRSALGIG